MYGSHGLLVQISYQPLVELGKSYNHKRSSATSSTIKFVHRSTQILCVPHIQTMYIELIWLTFRFSFCVWVCFQIEFEFSRTDCFKNSGKDLEDCSASNRVSQRSHQRVQKTPSVYLIHIPYNRSRSVRFYLVFQHTCVCTCTNIHVRGAYCTIRNYIHSFGAL